MPEKLRSKLRIRRRFEAAHLVSSSEGDCRNIHGHSYEVFFVLAAEVLPGGMVMSSSDVKAVVDPVLARLDHALIVDESSLKSQDLACVHRYKTMVLPEPATAEILAKYVFERVEESLPSLIEVEVRETENISASYGRI